MATSIGFYLSAVIAAGIIFIGGRFLVAPSLAAAGYGVPAGTEPHSRAYLSAKGIRDIASGLFAAILIAYGSAHPLGWFMLAALSLSIGDAAIVLHQGGSRAVAFGIHGSTAAAMLIISGLLLFSWRISSEPRTRKGVPRGVVTHSHQTNCATFRFGSFSTECSSQFRVRFSPNKGHFAASHWVKRWASFYRKRLESAHLAIFVDRVGSVHPAGRSGFSFAEEPPDYPAIEPDTQELEEHFES
jgi:Domain of unknown function (DUF4267)